MVFTLRDSLSNISFCDKQCSNLNNNKAKEDMIRYVEKKYPIKIIDRQYVPLNPHMLRNVSYHQHILSTLTNGNTYLLFLTQIDGINCCFYIDRKLKGGYTYPKIHCVKYRFDNELFEKETVFSGELIRDNDRKWFFIIADILVYKGNDTKNKNILSKYELIYDILNKEYTQDIHMEICPLQVKKLFRYDQVDSMINDFIPNLSYVCKGIVFNTLDTKFTNYALILPRDKQLEVVDKTYIDSLIERKNPELLMNAKPVMDYSNNNQLQSSYNNDYIDPKAKYNTVSPETAGIVANSTNYNNSQNRTINNNNYVNKTDRTMDSKNNSKINSNNNSNNNSKINSNNVIFRVLNTESPDIYNLYCLDGEQLSKNSIALIPTIKISQKMNHLFQQNDDSLEVNMECYFSKIFERWVPDKIVKSKPYTKDKVLNIEKNLIHSC
jgi:hypothetical protein